jgi:Flp pilus assembly protein TadD
MNTKLLLVLVFSVLSGSLWAQNNTEKPPTQSEMELLMKEAQKVMEEMSPEDKKMMEGMGVPANSFNTVPQIGDQKLAEAWENDGKIVPARKTNLIAKLPKKIFSNQELAAYVKKMNASVAKTIKPESKQMADQLIEQAKNDKYSGALMASAANGLWTAGYNEAAVYLMGKATEILPNADNYNNYAAYLTMTGAAHIAIPILDKLNSVHKKNSTILNNLGHAWLQLGEGAKAEKYLDSTIRIYPAHPQANYTKCLIQEEKGNIPEATEALKNSMKHSVTKKKLNKLKQLEKKKYNPRGFYVRPAYYSASFDLAAYASLIPDEYAKSAGSAVEKKWQEFRDLMQLEKDKIESMIPVVEMKVQQESININQKAKQKRGILFPPNYYKAMEASRIYAEDKNRNLQNRIEKGTSYIQEWAAMKDEFTTQLDNEKRRFEEEVSNGANLQVNCEGELPIITKYVTAINVLNRKYNEETVQRALRESYQEFHIFTDIAISDAAALLVVLELKRSFLETLISLNHESYEGLPADCMGTREEEKPFVAEKLPDFDEVNCSYLDVVHFYGMGTWTIRCNTMTMDLNPIILPFSGSLTGNFDGYVEAASVAVSIKGVDLNVGAMFDKEGNFVSANTTVGTSFEVKGPLEAVVKGISVSVTGEIDANGFTKGSAELGLESEMQFIPEFLEGEAPVQINLKNELGVAIELGEGGPDVYIKDKISGDVASNIEHDTEVETSQATTDKFGNTTEAETVDLQGMINQMIDPENETISSPSVAISADNRWCVNTGYTSKEGELSGLNTDN